MQRSDSPARNVPGFWLGDPSSGLRWPFDATFTAWKVWGMLVIPSFVALWLLLPLGLVLAGAVRAFSRYAARSLPVLIWRRRNWTGRLAGAAMALLALAALPYPRLWLLPLPWFVALLAAPLLAVVIARLVMPWITTNTPLSYWRNLLPRIAGAPRARRAPGEYVAVTDYEISETPMHDLELLALTIDPRKVVMSTATPRVQPVEFFAWTPHIPHDAAQSIAWASTHGAQCMVNPESHVLALLVDGEAVYANPGHIVYRDHTGAFHTTSPANFARDFLVEQVSA